MKKYPPPIPHMRAPGAVSEEEIAKVKLPPPLKKKRKKLQLILIAVGAVLVLAGAGYFVYIKFLVPPPPPPPVVKKPTAPAAKPPAPTTTATSVLKNIVDAPGKLIDDGKQAIAQHRADAQDRVDAAAVGTDAPDKAAPQKQPEAPVATATSQLAPGVTATTAVNEVAGGASAAFRTWVANAQISGVFQGDPPRILLNHKLYHSGQVVDDGLGITFDGIDPKSGLIVFRDKSGMTVSRHF
jgi:hypothetical protein